MTPTLDKERLLAELSDPDLLTVTGRADLLRRGRFGDRATFCLIRSLDVGWSDGFSPIAGLELTTGSRAIDEIRAPGDLTTALLERAHPAAGDYHILVAEGTDFEGLLAHCRAAVAAVGELMAYAPPHAVGPTFQVGTASDWNEALAAASIPAGDGMARAAEMGLRVVSDGVRPRVHPALGGESAQRWSEFWRACGAIGIRGNATVLFGPELGLPQVLDQVEAIWALQDSTLGEDADAGGGASGAHGHEIQGTGPETARGPFQSVAPVVFSAAGFGGPGDALLTHGQEDLRVLSACRLGLPAVPHLRMIYARSDLKMAHLGLACGVDDLEGPLFDGERGAKADAESTELSLDEMDRWLGEAGHEPALRNGAFEIQPPEDETTA